MASSAVESDARSIVRWGGAVVAKRLLMLTAALLTRSSGLVSNFSFMTLVGLGLYLPYVAMHTTLFERLLAMTRDRGNIGFLMYVADSVGYLGYVTVMVARNFGPAAEDFFGLLKTACWLAIGILMRISGEGRGKAAFKAS